MPIVMGSRYFYIYCYPKAFCHLLLEPNYKGVWFRRNTIANYIKVKISTESEVIDFMDDDVKY